VGFLPPSSTKGSPFGGRRSQGLHSFMLFALRPFSDAMGFFGLLGVLLDHSKEQIEDSMWKAPQ